VQQTGGGGGGSGPPVPTGLHATNIGKTSVTVAWAASTGATSYLVKVGDKRAPVSVTETSYTATGLKPKTHDYYIVAAVNSSGTSAYSAHLDVTTK
jgi:hypothetical protein